MGYTGKILGKYINIIIYIRDIMGISLLITI
jgi:hypothetical protein